MYPLSLTNSYFTGIFQNNLNDIIISNFCREIYFAEIKCFEPHSSDASKDIWCLELK